MIARNIIFFGLKRKALFLAVPLFFFASLFSPAESQTKNSLDENLKREFKRLGITVFDTPREIASFDTFTLEGEKVSLSGFKGKYVFLNFWATWCPPRRMEMPSMEKLNTFFKGKDFVILAVSLGEEAGAVQDFLEENPYTFPITLNRDGRLAGIYAPRGIPTSYILDRDGRVIAARLGAMEWDTAECFSLFSKLLDTP